MKILRRAGIACRDHIGKCVWILGALTGLICLTYYYAQGLTTAHYDAKAHLLIARSLTDSRSPGYEQMGAHWLPLLHLLYFPMVMLESQYRTGFLPSLLSVFSFSVSVWLIFRITLDATELRDAALLAAAIFAGNPNLQYLQSCPLTEPVFMMFNLLALRGLLGWRRQHGAGLPWLPACWAALGSMCRYEGWYFLAGLGILLLWDLGARRIPAERILRGGAVLLGMSALPIMLHLGYIYLATGDSFFHRVARGYANPYETQGRLVLSGIYHLGELWQVGTTSLLLTGLAGTLFFISRPAQIARLAPLLLLWIPSLINVSALFWGLIYRVRYSTLLIPALAILGGQVFSSDRASRRVLVLCSLTVMALPWLSWCFPHEWRYHFMYPGPGKLLLPVVALAILGFGLATRRYAVAVASLCLVGMHLPALRGEDRAVLTEAREHAYIEPQRERILDYLKRHYDGTGILIDMSRQAPLIYDSGLPVRDFIYSESDPASWRTAAKSPEEVAGWLVCEAGDELGRRLRIDPGWAGGYSLAVQTGSFSLFRLKPEYKRRLPEEKQAE